MTSVNEDGSETDVEVNETCDSVVSMRVKDRDTDVLRLDVEPVVVEDRKVCVADVDMKEVSVGKATLLLEEGIFVVIDDAVDNTLDINVETEDDVTSTAASDADVEAVEENGKTVVELSNTALELSVLNSTDLACLKSSGLILDTVSWISFTS